MFQTSSVHHQERFVQAAFADFGMCFNTKEVMYEYSLYKTLLMMNR